MQVRKTGFTLIELIMVLVILGVLAAFLVPKLINLGSDARAASVAQMHATLQTTAANLRAKCATLPTCNVGAISSFVYVDGTSVIFRWGWPDGGPRPSGGSQSFGIEKFITQQGFTVSYLLDRTTVYAPVGAVDASRCFASYTEANTANPPPFNQTREPIYRMDVSGC